MKRKFKMWRLEDINGNVIAEGRKKEVGGKAYFRYVYQHIFTDLMYSTDEWL